jgi:hypothetical protein
MSGDRDTTRIVRSWLDEGVTQLPDRVMDAVLDEIPAIPQRRGSWGGANLPHVSRAVQFALATAAVLLVAALGLAMLVSGPIVVGPEAPAPTATPSPMTLPLEPISLKPGTYAVDDPFPVRVTFDVPSGWTACGGGPLEAGACRGDIAGVSFMIVDNVVSDPCDPSQPQLEPPVGPSVDDLVTAISNLRGFEATDPVDVRVDGFEGKQFVVTAPGYGFCEDGISTWSNADRTNGVGAGEVNLLRILDVAGTRLMVAAAYPSRTTTDRLAEIRRVFDSVHVAP